MIITETERLRLRHIEQTDAEFIHNLYNQPSFIQYIGGRGVHSVEDAKTFIDKVQDHYRHYGFWLYLVEHKTLNTAIGVNGLIQRDYLDAPDIGFALLPQFWGKGYAKESSLAVIEHARQLKLPTLYAITSPANTTSEGLLKAVGFDFVRQDCFDDDSQPVNLFQRALIG